MMLILVLLLSGSFFLPKGAQRRLIMLAYCCLSGDPMMMALKTMVLIKQGNMSGNMPKKFIRNN